MICSKRKLTECLKSIANSKEVSKTLNIAKLSTFIEEDGTNRVNCRLKRSKFDYNAKHPLFLTAKCPVVQLLSEKTHRDNLHKGTEYVRNIFKQKLWIVGLRNALKNHFEMYQMHTHERQPNPPTDGRPTPRTLR